MDEERERRKEGGKEEPEPLDMMAHGCNLSTGDAEAGGSQVQGQTGWQWDPAKKEKN